MKKYAIYLITAMVILITTGCAEKLDKDKFKYDVKYLAVSDVKLNKNTLTLLWNSRETLKATVSPERADNREITWSSSNENVATVNSLGEVVAVGVGEADIIVTSEDNGSKKDVCKLTVNPYVYISKTTLSLLVDQKETLTANVQPASSPQSITWATSNNKIAIVSATGEITAIANGKADITATMTGGFKATCVVTVGNVPVDKVELVGVYADKVTGVEVICSEYIDIDINQSVTLTATVFPANAWNKAIEWKVKGTTLEMTPTPDDPYKVTVKRIAKGEGTITVVTNDGGREAKCLFEEDPHFWFTGRTGSKTWEWEAFEWGNGRFGSGIDKNPWWKAEDFVDFFTNTYKSKEVGATMTFTHTGLKFEKIRTDLTKESGTFSLNNTKKSWNNNAWSIGQLVTKDATIIWGRFIDISKVNDSEENSDKKPKPGEYPNGEADLAKAYIFDIIKATDDKLILAIPAGGIKGNIAEWDGAWYWTFKPKQ